jgi:hypothetical protein
VADNANDQTVTADSTADGENQEAPQSEQRPARFSRLPGQSSARRGNSTGPVVSAVRRVRAAIATLVFTVAVLAALVLALGAVLTALGANEGNTLVAAVISLAGRLDGPFADIFTFDSAVKQTLVNWAIAAGVYLIAGSVLRRLIGP